MQCGIHGEKVNIAAAGQKTDHGRLNLVLLALAGLLLVWYAYWANYLGAAGYRETDLKIRLTQLSEENYHLLQQKSEATGLKALTSFSNRSGLVEQKTVNYILGQDSVAQIQNKTIITPQ